jgi:UDP-GlcNAc3NAcA epimerase
VEAGLRSFNKGMPEEINRILTDHISSVFFCPTTTAVQNLANEGIIKNVHHVGDVMYDAALEFGALAERQSFILEQLSLTSKAYILATVHRAENTDNPERLTKIFQLFCKIATEDVPVILPIHPRTKNALLKNTIAYEKVSLVENSAIPNLLGFTNPNVITIPPVSFLDMVMLEKNAKAIMTDSGGVQKEAYFHKVPCVTLRSETEWVETVNAGWNIVAFDNKKIQIDGDFFDSTQYRSTIYEYGAGSASYNILKVLSK